MVVDTVTSFVDCLRRAPLLKPNQLAELTSFQNRFPDARSLAGELVRRNWLTSYQAKLLLAGKVNELTLGSYVVLDLLGEGGMGQVFKGRHAKLGKTVALKVIRRDYTTNTDAVRRFQREIQAASRVSHPHIVHSLDAESSGDSHFLVMEYIEGTDLARLVKQQGPLPVAQACDYIRQAALGLQHAHERGMVHRDIKPANLLMSQTPGPPSVGIVKIADMGLARWRSTDESSSKGLTREGSVLGTVDYVAPEQAMDSHAVDIRADLYSLGCAFYFLLTGRVPFPGGEALEKLYRHRYEQPATIESLRPDVPASVRGMVGKLMAKQPEDRYQTPGELAAALASLQAGKPVPGVAIASVAVIHSKQPVGPAARKSSRARPWRRIVLAGGVLLVAGAGLLIFLTRDPARPSVPMAMQRPSAVVMPTRASTSPTASETRPDTRPSPTKRVDPPVVPPTSPTVEMQTPREIRQFKGHVGPVNCLSLSPDGKLLLSASDDKTLRLWDVDTGREVRQFKGHTDLLHSVVFSSEGQRALSTSGRYDGSDKSIRLWNVSDGTEIRRFEGHEQPASCALFLGDGRALSVGADSTIRLWNVETGQLRNTFPIKPKVTLYSGVCLENGTQVLVGASDSLIRLMDLQEGRELRRFVGHTNKVYGLTLSPDGKVLASASADSTIRTWEFETGKPIRTLTGHTASVGPVIFLRDGKRLLSASADRTIRIWDAASGQELLRWGAHNSSIHCVTLSLDERFLFSAGDDRTIKLWPLAR